MESKLPSTLVVCALLTSNLNAQNSGTLNINDVEMRVYSNGDIGRAQGDTQPGFVVPASSGVSPLYSAGLWLGGLTSDGQLKLAAHMYGTGGTDFFPGPLTVDGSASITQQVSDAYDQVWTVNNADVLVHRAYFDCINDPNCDVNVEFPNGYTVPSNFVNWPANGNAAAGQDLYLAPFTDHDGDGFYDPFAGDYPCVPGDQALYTIFNDKLAPHTESGGDQIGVEIHMMPFAYSTAGPALAQTVFVHYTVINRGTQTLTDFRIGHFEDFDIGCPEDDFAATDVGRNLIYAYNWDVNDETCQGGSALGYGPQPPAFGMTLLKGPLMDADATDNSTDPPLQAFNGSGFSDGIIDNERNGLTNSIFMNRQGPTEQTAPGTPIQYYQYLRSIWKDGRPLSYGGNGYSNNPTALSCSFQFPMNSDPLGVGTNGIPQLDWRELAPTPASPDRSGVATFGSITLEPGAEHDLLIAYVFARDPSNSLYSVTALQQRVDSVAAFAATIPGIMAEGNACDGFATGIADRHAQTTSLGMQPVPATDRLTVNTTGIRSGTALTIIDARGKEVAEHVVRGSATVLDLSTLQAGVYMIRIVQGDGVRTGRFVKQ